MAGKAGRTKAEKLSMKNLGKFMSNRWGIPKEVEELVKKRDTNCIYCRTEFSSNAASTNLSPSWEHII